MLGVEEVKAVFESLGFLGEWELVEGDASQCFGGVLGGEGDGCGGQLDGTDGGGAARTDFAVNE